MRKYIRKRFLIVLAITLFLSGHLLEQRSQAGCQVSNGGVSPFSSTDTFTAYAAGTVYTITNAQALLDFGTTDPTITLTKPGTYLIFGRANFENVGATYAANRTVTTKLRRTNNTATDLTGATTSFGTGVITTLSSTCGVVETPPVLYSTALTTDIIQMFGGIDTIASAGSTTCTEACIVAIRLY